MNPLFIIGPARSGTKILRDTISQSVHINSVPYDVNDIWKYARNQISDDSFNVDSKPPNRQILKLLDKYNLGATFVLEKTVSNTLRIEWLAKNFPEAKFIILTRSGSEVVESVIRQWSLRPNLLYLIRKMKIYPWKVLFSVGIRHVFNIVSRNNPNHWGVLVPGLYDKSTVDEKACYQWFYCIKSMSQSIHALRRESYHLVKYEDFVRNPQEVLKGLSYFLFGDEHTLDVNSDAVYRAISPSTYSGSSIEARAFLEEGEKFRNKLNTL